jgi:hypothetical protein
MPKNVVYPSSRPPVPAPERLVSIESQSEFDVFTGERQDRLFLKLYVAARTSGLLAAISDRDWKTLCVLATYMDATGFCFPSQAELSHAMGCSRQMVSERVNSLARFRFQDQPVLVIANEKHKTNGRFSHNGYRVLPLASLGIFDEVGESGTTERRKQGPKPTVSRKPDTVEATVSSDTGTVELDTNNTQYFLNEISLSKSSKSTHSNDDFVDNSVSHPISGNHRDVESKPAPATGHQTMTTIGLEDIGAVLRRRQDGIASDAPGRGGERRRRSRQRALPAIPPEEYEAVVRLMRDYSRTLGDMEHIESNITHAVNLMQKAGVDFNTVYMFAIEAERETKKRTRLTNRMGYFFSVLEDRLGLKVHDAGAPPPH